MEIDALEVIAPASARSPPEAQGSQIRLRQRDAKHAGKALTKTGRALRSSSSLGSVVDELYFLGYGEIGIHQEMLRDEVRMSAYKLAIDKLAQGRTIIDVGAGTGVLSLMAA